MRRLKNCDAVRRGLLLAAAMVPAFAAARVVSAANAATGVMPPADLAEAIRRYDEATTRNDTRTLAGLVADDYVLVNSDSSLQDKKSYLADFDVPGFKVDAYVIREPLLKVWQDAAVAGGLLPLKWTLDGKRHQRLLRVVHVWSRQGRDWRLTYTQLTRVPE